VVRLLAVSGAPPRALFGVPAFEKAVPQLRGGAGRLRRRDQVKAVAIDWNVACRSDGDQSGDETIFDGRDAGSIVDKATEQITHD
jgi:hypothetical protein